MYEAFQSPNNGWKNLSKTSPPNDFFWIIFILKSWNQYRSQVWKKTQSNLKAGPRKFVNRDVLSAFVRVVFYRSRQSSCLNGLFVCQKIEFQKSPSQKQYIFIVKFNKHFLKMKKSKSSFKRSMLMIPQSIVGKQSANASKNEVPCSYEYDKSTQKFVPPKVPYSGLQGPFCH